MNDLIKYTLPEQRIPEAWYNIVADLPAPPPPVLHPATGEPVTAEDLSPLFPDALIAQEMATDREIEIPTEVRNRLPSVAAHAALSRSPSGTRVADAGQDLLQVRRG